MFTTCPVCFASHFVSGLPSLALLRFSATLAMAQATPRPCSLNKTALQDVSNVQHPRDNRQEVARSSSPWLADIPSQIKRKQLKNLSKKLRFRLLL